MPLRRLSSSGATKQGVGLFARMSVKGSTKKSLCPSYEAWNPGQDTLRQSVATDSSSSVGEEHGPVDLDQLDEKMAEMKLIHYFEDGKETEETETSNLKSGPIDLDLLDDDFHHYDQFIDVSKLHKDSKLQNKFAAHDIRNNVQQGYVGVNIKKGTAESREDQTTQSQTSVSECLDTDCDVDGVANRSGYQESSSGDKRGSAPVDMDDVHDLETTFDTILDEHEDNFMVWTANRKSINAIISAEEQAVTRSESRKYGHSLRRERKRWSS